MPTTRTHPDIQIIYEDPDLLVVNKPSNLLSQKDSTGDPDLFTLCKSYLQKNHSENSGKPYLGLLHRLDRPVSGLMMLAKTKNSAKKLSTQIRKREIRKFYRAVVEGELPPNGTWVHHLEKENQTNVVKISTPNNREAKYAELGFIRESYSPSANLSLVKINLLTGRPHQIRVQFAAKGHAVFGDSKYGKHSHPKKELALQASQLIFSHPVTHKSLNFSLPLINSIPWNLFAE